MMPFLYQRSFSATLTTHRSPTYLRAPPVRQPGRTFRTSRLTADGRRRAGMTSAISAQIREMEGTRSERTERVNTDQRPPTSEEKRRTDTDRRPAVRIIGLQVWMFWTAIVVFIVGIIVILYFAL